MPRSLVDPSGRFQGSGRWEWERCYLDGPDDGDRPKLGWPEPRREAEAPRGEQAPARTDAPFRPRQREPRHDLGYVLHVSTVERERWERTSDGRGKRHEQRGEPPTDVGPRDLEARRTTMQSKHTPGPWGFKEAPANGSSQVTDADGYVIAMVTRGNRRGVDPTRRLVHDARLIAAAPDLLEACHGVDVLYAEMQAVLPSMVGTPGFDAVQNAVRAARAAIAKATGNDR